MGKVIVPDAFVDSLLGEQIKDLKESGAEFGIMSDDELGLHAPKSGEKVVGELTNEEAGIYSYLITLSNRRVDINNSISGDVMIKAGEAIRSSGNPDFDRIRNEVNSEKVIEIFKVSRLIEAVHGIFWLRLCNRIDDIFDYNLSIRTRKRIVILDRKW